MPKNLLSVVWELDTYSSAMLRRNQLTPALEAILDGWADETLDKALTDAVLQGQITAARLANGFATDHEAAKHLEFEANKELFSPRSAFTRLDLVQRLNLLEQAAQAAARWANQHADGPDVLFVAPEYYFARDGYRHLLPGAALTTIQTGLARISRRFPNMLLMPGTVAVREAMAQNTVKARARMWDNANALATTPYAFVATENRDQIHNIAMRGAAMEMASNRAMVYRNGRKLMEYRKRGNFHEVTADDAAAGEAVFVPGGSEGKLKAFGLDFGFEICLDHNMGYAMRSPGGGYDIHVIMSAAVQPVPASEKTKAGETGYVVHASCVPEYTQVVRRNGGRALMAPIWNHGIGGGFLRGHRLALNTAGDTNIARGNLARVKERLATKLAI